MKLYNEEVAEMAVQHHESFDGKGYPHSLSKYKIFYFRQSARQPMLQKVSHILWLISEP
jgi:hypothetical protein